MTGSTPGVRRGRPTKTGDLQFRLLALSAVAGERSQRDVATRVSNDLTGSVSQPTVGSWMQREFPGLADVVVSLQRPNEVGVLVAYLLFQPRPGQERALSRRLLNEELVSRVERCTGEFTVIAEVTCVEPDDLDDLAERLDPAIRLQLDQRWNRTAEVLRRLGQNL